MPKVYTVIIDSKACTMTRYEAAEYKHANDKAFRILGGG